MPILFLLVGTHGFRAPSGRRADKAYTKTSSEGWVYAIDFNAMKFNLRSGIYFTNSFLQVSLRLMGHYFYTIGILHHIE
jgi:hypothetical protein